MSQPSLRTAITPDFISRALHLKGPLMPRANLPFSAVVTDSRKITPGCLFVALPGDQFDGHQFIESAIQQGARGILCKRNTVIPPTQELCVFSVDDTVAGYRKIAASFRREFSIPIIVVAGSAGKTTTKELLAAILSGKWPSVLKTTGSQNGYIGIPMTLLELKPEHGAAVIEVGIDEIGAMQGHMALINANAAVLTSIGPEHMEFLQDVPTIAREEGVALSHVAKNGGMVVINMDDPWIRPHMTSLKEGRKIPFSLNGQMTSIDMIHGNQILPASPNEKEKIRVGGLDLVESTYELPIPGKHNASNLLAAIAVAAGLGLTAEQIQQGLKNFTTPTGRSQIETTPSHVTVICDYYNAQPASVVAGLELLEQLSKRHGHTESSTRWVCLADMLELGPTEESLHRNLAGKIIELDIENVLLMGPRMEFLRDELKKGPFRGQCQHYSTHTEMAQALISQTKPHDWVLIKGSRGMKMEEVWNAFKNGAKPHSAS